MNETATAEVRKRLESRVADAFGSRYIWALHTEPVKRAIDVAAAEIVDLQVQMELSYGSPASEHLSRLSEHSNARPGVITATCRYNRLGLPFGETA